MRRIKSGDHARLPPTLRVLATPAGTFISRRPRNLELIEVLRIGLHGQDELAKVYGTPAENPAATLGCSIARAFLIGALVTWRIDVDELRRILDALLAHDELGAAYVFAPRVVAAEHSQAISGRGAEQEHAQGIEQLERSFQALDGCRPVVTLVR